MDNKMLREAADGVRDGLDQWSGELDDDTAAQTIYDTGVSVHNALRLATEASSLDPDSENELLAGVIRAHTALTDTRFMRGVTRKTQKAAVSVSAPVDQLVATFMVSRFMANRETQ